MIIYQHRRLDTDEVFYIGIGKSEKRAYDKYNRSEFWKRITNKTDYSVEIVTTCDTWSEACQIEQYLIKYYGRRDLGLGPLVNLTDGGEGMLGHKASGETRTKMSKSHTGKFISDETKELLRLINTGENNPMYGVKGAENPLYNIPRSCEVKMKISKTRIKKGVAKGSNNPMYGKKHTQKVKDISSKKVIDITTGVIYNSAKEVSDLFNINYSTLRAKLNGAIKINNTNFKYLNND